MQFYIEGYVDSHGIPMQIMNIFPHVKLVTDDFDDFGKQTLFRMYYKVDMYFPYSFIGKVKILNSNNNITRNIIPHSFTKLMSEFCSLGQTTEYYKNLRALNRSDIELGGEILSALNDIAIRSDIKKNFKDQYGITSTSNNN